jgi:hypothetical protein
VKLSQNSSTIAAIIRLRAVGPGRFSSRHMVETVGISVYGRAVANQPAMALVKRSPKRTAN